MTEIISKFRSSHMEVEPTHVTVHILLCGKLDSVHICGRSASTNWTNFLCPQIKLDNFWCPHTWTPPVTTYVATIFKCFFLLLKKDKGFKMIT